MRLKHSLLFLVACSLLAATAFAGSRIQNIALNAQGQPIPNASVRVCPEQGQPQTPGCSPLATLYSDANLTAGVSNPTTADANGNYGFYVVAGVYRVEVSGQGATFITPGVQAGSVAVRADEFKGNDWCAKVTAADSALGSSAPGTIYMLPGAGTSQCSAAATLSSNRRLEFVQPGTYVTSCSGISISGVSNVEIRGSAGAALQMAAGCADSSRPINILSSNRVTVSGLEINGNGNNQSSGQQSHGIEINDSNQIKITGDYIHDAQGDGVNVNTDASLTTGCEDVLISGDSFVNLGRQFVSVTGYGCNDMRVLGNHFNYGTLVTASTAHGNAIHFEGDNAGTAFQRIAIAGNTIQNAIGEGISVTTQSGNPTLGLSIANNFISITNSGSILAAGIVVISVQDGSITGNHVNASGTTAGTAGIIIQESAGIAAQSHRIVVADNSVEGTSSDCYQFANSASSGQGSGFDFHDNLGNACGGVGLNVLGGNAGIANLVVHHNTFTNLSLDGMDMISAVRFVVDHNVIRDFGLAGGATTYYGVNATCNASFVNLGPGTIDGNLISNATVTLKDGIGGGCSTGTGIRISNNNLVGNALPLNFPLLTGVTFSVDNNWGQGAPTCTISGWGTGATCTVPASSNDVRGEALINVGTSPSPNPTITITFGAALPLIPWVVTTFEATTGNSAAWPTCCAPVEVLGTESTTSFKWTYLSTPTASPATYAWNWQLFF